MRHITRVPLVLSPAADAVVTDCTFTKTKNLVTLSISNSDTTGYLYRERAGAWNQEDRLSRRG